MGADLALMAALDASGFVGSWDWDHVRHEAVYDRGAAALLAGDADLAGRPLVRECALRCIHPDDIGTLVSYTAAATKRGEPFVAQYRVVPPGAPARLLCSRGRIFLDEDGRPLRSRGILIDITECREASPSHAAQAGDPLRAARDRVTGARALLSGVATFRLRTAIDIALMEIGRLIAHRTERERQQERRRRH